MTLDDDEDVRFAFETEQMLRIDVLDYLVSTPHDVSHSHQQHSFKEQKPQQTPMSVQSQQQFPEQQMGRMSIASQQTNPYTDQPLPQQVPQQYGVQPQQPQQQSGLPPVPQMLGPYSANKRVQPPPTAFGQQQPQQGNYGEKIAWRMRVLIK